MKKALITSVVLFIAAAGYSQHLSVNAYGGYTFGDRINFGGGNTYINPSGMWGASIEGVNAQGMGVELLYQYQSTKTPTTIYSNPVNQLYNANTVVSYLLLNFERYLLNNPKIQPYAGIGLGAAFYKSDAQGVNGATKFAWDLKAGVKIKASSVVGIKIGAQLLGSAQATGTAFYQPGPGYPVYPYTTYATILQFGFTGGLVFDFGGN